MGIHGVVVLIGSLALTSTTSHARQLHVESPGPPPEPGMVWHAINPTNYHDAVTDDAAHDDAYYGAYDDAYVAKTDDAAHDDAYYGTDDAAYDDAYVAQTDDAHGTDDAAYDDANVAQTDDAAAYVEKPEEEVKVEEPKVEAEVEMSNEKVSVAESQEEVSASTSEATSTDEVTGKTGLGAGTIGGIAAGAVALLALAVVAARRRSSTGRSRELDPEDDEDFGDIPPPPQHGANDDDVEIGDADEGKEYGEDANFVNEEENKIKKSKWGRK